MDFEMHFRNTLRFFSVNMISISKAKIKRRNKRQLLLSRGDVTIMMTDEPGTN